MNEIIKLVKTCRVTAGVAERLRLAEEIFHLIEPDLRFFVFRAIRPTAAKDVLQEVLKAVATGMKKFPGGSNEEFWAWCYRIARNKLNDHFRRQAADRVPPMPPGRTLAVGGIVRAGSVVMNESRTQAKFVRVLKWNP
jgi:DNA-directed RNA polymerase specialized sigma24 family protein